MYFSGLLRAYFALCFFFNITENKSVTLLLIKQYIELTDLLQQSFYRYIAFISQSTAFGFHNMELKI